MSKPAMTVLSAVLLFIYWLATGHVTVLVAGVPVVLPAALVVAPLILTAGAAVAAFAAWRIRAERAVSAAWQARRAGAR